MLTRIMKHFRLLCLCVFLSTAVFSPLHAQSDNPTPAAESALVEVARLGRGWVSDLSWTADGDAIVAASYSGIWRYGLDDSEALLSSSTGSVISANYSVNTTENSFSISALSTGEPLDLQPTLNGAPLSAISPDETRLALVDSAGIQFWSLPDGELISAVALENQPLPGTLSFSPDSRMFAGVINLPRDSAQLGGPRTRDDVFIWDVQTGKQVTILTNDGQDRIVTSTEFSSDSQSLITARIGGVTAFDIASGDFRHFNLPALAPVREDSDFRIVARAVFFGDDTRIAAAWTETLPGKGMPSYITVWDVETGEVVSEVGDIYGYVGGLTASPDGTKLAVYSYTGAILVWDAEGEAQGLTDQHPAGGEVLAVHGDMLAVGAFDRAVRLWSLSQRELTTTIYAHNSNVSAVAFSADGLLASASLFDTWTWDAENGVQDIDLPNAYPLALSFDGDTLYGATGTIRTTLWLAPPDGIETHELQVDASWAAAAAGRTAVYTENREIIVYDLAGEVQTRFTPSEDITLLRMSPDGSLLLAGDAQGAALWRLDAVPELVWRAARDSNVTAAAFSPDERFVAIGTVDGTLEVRSREDGTLIAVTNTTYGLYDVTFSPDSTTLIGALNTQIGIWEIQ